jgi:ATP-binding cassette subfamily F protein uup
MDHLVDQLFVFEGDGVIRLFNGNYSDYRNWVEGQEDDESELEYKPVKVETPSTPEKKKLSNKEKMEFEKLQPEIDALESKKAALNDQLMKEREAQKLIEISREIDKLSAQIDVKTARWFELSSLMQG